MDKHQASSFKAAHRTHCTVFSIISGICGALLAVFAIAFFIVLALALGCDESDESYGYDCFGKVIAAFIVGCSAGVILICFGCSLIPTIIYYRRYRIERASEITPSLEEVTTELSEQHHCGILYMS